MRINLKSPSGRPTTKTCRYERDACICVEKGMNKILIFRLTPMQVIRQPGGQPYGRSEVVEVMGLVTGPSCINELGHVDIVQPQGKPFSGLLS